MNPARRAAQPEDPPPAAPRGPLGAMYAIPELQVRCAVKALDTFATRRRGRVQSFAVAKLLAGSLAICRGLLILMREHVARSDDRAEAEQFRHVLATLDVLLAAEVDAKFGPAPVLDFAEATRAETRAQAELDALQVEGGLTPSPETCDRIRAAGGRVMAALHHMIGAAARRATLTSASSTARGWS